MMPIRPFVSVWVHGEDLRRWHNRQYGKEGAAADAAGGIVSTSTFTVEPKR